MREKSRRQTTRGAFYRTNHQITARTVRLLDEEGKQIGVVGVEEARREAEERGLDLVEVAAKAEPPVVKIIDFQKFLYQQKKKKQEEKRKSSTSETKQIQLGPFIDTHDLEIKVRRGKEFITDGDKVKFVVKFKGRQITRTELGEQVLKKVIEMMTNVAKVEREIKMEGRQMTLVMSKGAKEHGKNEVKS